VEGCDGLNFEQDLADHRPISRSLVKPRDARAAGIGDIPRGAGRVTFLDPLCCRRTLDQQMLAMLV
jgi:hypothetical protein